MVDAAQAQAWFNNEHLWQQSFSKEFQETSPYKPNANEHVFFTGALESDDADAYQQFTSAGLTAPWSSKDADKTAKLVFLPEDGRKVSRIHYDDRISIRCSKILKEIMEAEAETKQLHRIEFIKTTKKNVFRPVLFGRIALLNDGVNRIIKLPDIFIVQRPNPRIEGTVSISLATSISHGHKTLGVDPSKTGGHVFIESSLAAHVHVI